MDRDGYVIGKTEVSGWVQVGEKSIYIVAKNQH